MNDKSLIELLNANPTEGMKMLEKHFGESLYYTVGQRLQSKADISDCVSDTLEDFYLQRDKFDAEKGTLKAYLTAIADRKAIHKFHENNLIVVTEHGIEAPAVDELSRWEDRELLNEAMEKLSGQDRKIVELRYYEGYTVRQIAEMMEMNYETVKKRLQRAYKKLRTIL
ncbi:MAG: sigma-70 family RNA polymerase sigma factor [Clostridia bacterium]|nr:sigma-70 family RNA polymerase sigma factor [Clostridia bacterium]